MLWFTYLKASSPEFNSFCETNPLTCKNNHAKSDVSLLRFLFDQVISQKIRSNILWFNSERKSEGALFFVRFSAFSLSMFVLQGIEGKKLVGKFQRAG